MVNAPPMRREAVQHEGSRFNFERPKTVELILKFFVVKIVIAIKVLLVHSDLQR
jgi:hypothetical protein